MDSTEDIKRKDDIIVLMKKQYTLEEMMKSGLFIIIQMR